MQIYNPIVDPHDPRYGLNPWGHSINAVLIIFPNVLASIAFIGSKGSYSPNGAVCWLPVRPIWYGLALSWIPRYIIFVVISALSIIVYSHVGNQFKRFHRSWNIHFKPTLPSEKWQTMLQAFSKAGDKRSRKSSAEHETVVLSPRSLPQSDSQFFGDPVVLDAVTSLTNVQDKESKNYSTDMGSLNAPRHMISPLTLGQAFTRHSTASIAAFESGDQSPEAGASRKLSVTTNATVPSIQTQKSCQTRSSLHKLIARSFQYALNPTSPDRPEDLEQGLFNLSVGHSALDARRQTMIKQLKTTFIYPMVYIALWIVPFVLHCMEYKTSYALHPPAHLVALSTCCIASMGLVNALCFLIRERPWDEVGVWPRHYRRNSSQPTISDAPSWKSRFGQNPDKSLQYSRSNKAAIFHGILATRRSSASSSYFSRLAAPPGEYSTPPSNSTWMYGNRSSPKPWNAKSQALERLEIERSDRAQQNFEKHMAENLEVPGGSPSRMATPVSKPKRLDRNWWDDSIYSLSFRSGTSEDEQRIESNVRIIESDDQKASSGISTRDRVFKSVL
jgi:hypothetical protein